MSRKTRKLIWAAPLVAVFAVIGALALFMTQTPSPAQAHGLPGAVKNLMVTDYDYRTIDLSWDAPADSTVDSYRIDRSENGNVWMTHETGVTATMFQDTMLTAGEDYYYRVFAVNTAGTGPVSGEVTGATKAPEAPGAVRGLTARASDQNTVMLNWMAPASDGGTPITGYKIAVADDDGASDVIAPTLPTAAVVGTAATSTAQIILTGDNSVMYTHKMLTAGIRYQYNVYAVNEEGTSAETGDTVAATTPALEKPGAPTGVTAVQTGTRAFSLYWFAPTDIGGFNTDAGGDGIIDTTYTIQVSYNGSAFMDADPVITYTASDTASPDATHTVPATWDHDNDGGTTPEVAITKVRYQVYTITRQAQTGPPVVTELKSTSAGRSATMTIVSDAARSKNIPGPPTGGKAERDSFKNVDLEWTAPPLDASTPCQTDGTDCDDLVESISGFRIDVSDDGVNWMALVSSTGKTDPEYKYVDTEKKSRQYRIFTRHAQFLGPAADPVPSTLTTTVTNPGHVSGLTATAAGPTQIDLSWMAPTNTGNAPIVEYRIQMSMKGADGTFAEWPTAVTAATDGVEVSKTTSYSHMKLKAGQTWRYRVIAVNEDANGAQLHTSADGTGAEVRQATTTQAALPMAPEGLTAEDAKDSSRGDTTDRGVLLQWNAPDPPDGADIDGYRVQRKKGTADWETLAADTGDNHTDYTDGSEPEAGEMRQYRVAALNGTKAGAYSAPVYYPVMHMPDTAHIMATDMGIPEQTVTEGMSVEIMDVSMYFTVTEGITYTAMPKAGDEMYATAVVDGMKVTITGVMATMAGMPATITVKATEDATGLYAMQDVMVTVRTSNNAPMAVGTIDAQTVTANSMCDAAMDVSGYFSDADGDALTYTWESTSEATATASIDGKMVKILGHAAGMATVTVIATDPDGAMARQDIAVTVNMNLTAACNVEAVVDASDPGSATVKVTWTDGANAAQHGVVLLDSNGQYKNDWLSRHETDGMVTFMNIPSGTYAIIVASITADYSGMAFAEGSVTVP